MACIPIGPDSNGDFYLKPQNVYDGDDNAGIILSDVNDCESDVVDDAANVAFIEGVVGDSQAFDASCYDGVLGSGRPRASVIFGGANTHGSEFDGELRVGEDDSQNDSDGYDDEYDDEDVDDDEYDDYDDDHDVDVEALHCGIQGGKYSYDNEYYTDDDDDDDDDEVEEDDDDDDNDNDGVYVDLYRSIYGGDRPGYEGDNYNNDGDKVFGLHDDEDDDDDDEEEEEGEEEEEEEDGKEDYDDEVADGARGKLNTGSY
uniref:Uncharacterized protein n=1 Tax=Octopus bimaculoides TaxID=37653 RepID=A0A0L8FSQ8_OCTBM